MKVEKIGLEEFYKWYMHFYNELFPNDVLSPSEKQVLYEEFAEMERSGIQFYAATSSCGIEAIAIVSKGFGCYDSRIELLGNVRGARFIVEELVKEYKRPYVLIPSSLEEGLANLLTSMGFNIRDRFARMSLFLDIYNEEAFLPLITKLSEAGYTFQDLSILGVNVVKNLIEETLADEPTFGSVARAMIENILSDKRLILEACMAAFYGDAPVATTLVSRVTDNIAYFTYTGVDRHHRNKGLAKAVKALALSKLKRLGYQKVSTNVSLVNKPIVRVNLALGFKIMREYVGYAP